MEGRLRLPFDPRDPSLHKTEATYSKMRLERRNITRYVKGLRCRVWME